MREESLIAEIEKRRGSVPANTWEYLSKMGLVGEALDEVGEAAGRPIDYMVEQYDKLVYASPARATREKPLGRAPTAERPERQLKDAELERSWAYSEYVSRIANMDDNVRSFRSKYLGEDVISYERARDLLASPAAAIWSSFEFERARFPVLNHVVHVVEEGQDEKGHYLLVEARDPSTTSTKQFKDRRPRQAGAWSIHSPAQDALSNNEEAREIGDWGLLSFPDEEHGINRVCVKKGSVLGDLRKLVHKIIRRYPWWESEAVWFVLTGDTPWVSPVSVQARGTGDPDLFEYQFITIKAEPWVSEETIRRTYREAQIRMLQGDNRPVKDKRLDLFRFVSSRTNPVTLYGRERAKVGKELVTEWNSENPDSSYGDGTRRFWRDYDRALELIVLPMEAAEHREQERNARERRHRAG